MVTVYSKDLSKREIIDLAKEILKSFGFDFQIVRSPSSMVLIAEAIRFIIIHFQVTDQLVPLVISFLRKDINAVACCLKSLPDAYFNQGDFKNDYNSESLLKHISYATYLYPPLKRGLDEYLTVLVLGVYNKVLLQEISMITDRMDETVTGELKDMISPLSGEEEVQSI